MSDDRIDRVLDILSRMVDEIAELASEDDVLTTSSERRLRQIKRDIEMLQNHKPDEPIPYVG